MTKQMFETSYSLCRKLVNNIGDVIFIGVAGEYKNNFASETS